MAESAKYRTVHRIRAPDEDIKEAGSPTVLRANPEPKALAVLLFVSAFSSADTIGLTSGSGTIYPPFVAPGYSLQFNGSGYSIGIPGALEDFGGGLVNCNPCDQFPPLGPLFLASGGILAGSNPYLTGSIEFDAVSFVSSLDPNGVVTVRYTATASLQLFLIDATTGFPIAGPFVWGSPNPWLITAKFNPSGPTYVFAGATLVSTPEPIPLLLLSTGLAAIAWKARPAIHRRL